jgi:DNA-directed RNA polymerase specialized sigma24 family protein
MPEIRQTRATFAACRSSLDANRMEVGMPGEPPHVSEVESFLAERGQHLLRTAIVLAGSPDAGEDLLQAGLERMFRNWRRISGDPEGYLRRTLAHLAADGWRRRGRWRDQLVRLLAQLPPSSCGTGNS